MRFLLIFFHFCVNQVSGETRRFPPPELCFSSGFVLRATCFEIHYSIMCQLQLNHLLWVILRSVSAIALLSTEFGIAQCTAQCHKHYCTVHLVGIAQCTWCCTCVGIVSSEQELAPHSKPWRHSLSFCTETPQIGSDKGWGGIQDTCRTPMKLGQINVIELNVQALSLYIGCTFNIQPWRHSLSLFVQKLPQSVLGRHLTGPIP